VGSPFSASLLRPASASDFCDFLKHEYPDMMSSDIVDQLKSHNARCILHSNIFKDSIIRENMKLAKRVLDKLSQEKQSQRTSLRARREDYFSASESESESENKRARLKKNSTYIHMPFFLLNFHQNVFHILVYSSRSSCLIPTWLHFLQVELVSGGQTSQECPGPEAQQVGHHQVSGHPRQPRK
jgi:hypothetical protein